MSTQSKPYEKLPFNSARIKNAFFVGNELQIKAGLGVICQVLCDQKNNAKPMDYKILVIGPSGTGKSSYPEGLAKSFIESNEIKRLIEEAQKKNNSINEKFTLFHIRCNHLLSSYRDDESLRKVLTSLEDDVDRSRPAIVAFDELDAFLPERMRVWPTSPLLFYWTMSFMQKEGRGLIIFGILNLPKILEMAVMSQIDNIFRFRLLNQKTVEAILEHNKIPFADKIALRLCTSTSVVVLGNELKHAIEKAIRVLGGGNPKNLGKIGSDKISEFMMLWLKITYLQMKDFETHNELYNDKADKSMVLWREIFENFLVQGL